MPRVSKYNNDKTDTSKQFLDNLLDNLKTFTFEDVEKMQIEYGISDAELSDYLFLNRATISLWKTGKRDLTDYNKLTIFLVFKLLKDKYNGR
jgi:DNA-binding transcriptional regulator YiaG